MSSCANQEESIDPDTLLCLPPHLFKFFGSGHSIIYRMLWKVQFEIFCVIKLFVGFFISYETRCLSLSQFNLTSFITRYNNNILF